VMLDDPLTRAEMPPDVRIVYGEQSLGRWNEIEQDEDYQLPKVLLVVSNNSQILSHYCQGNFSGENRVVVEQELAQKGILFGTLLLSMHLKKAANRPRKISDSASGNSTRGMRFKKISI